ncbi:MAG TPA: A/G-specific adenine glycosylase [Smithella sp.]|nr:A/G-specific adenine glycosylase [Smithella sp.]MDM7988672.1 A/G-specific adenine glycosylase [Smithella sp.]HNY49383.1 A/G-specific adenine glycosylase [Smithella sp.]HOG89426.1 A/G-specific adenine glycosylase [Smithella sp.]HOU50211.1 A/G-specific adenine glycosylase [Smithella sp.]
MMQDADKIKSLLSRKLTSWYRRNQRSLPWRKTGDPYRIWISEIMLQQTQVDTVIPYYHRFLKAFPSVSRLAYAPLQDVLKVWENLGYYSRARNLHAAAKVIVEKFSGQIPDNFEDIKSLPGIGQYTAGAISSIAYGQNIPAVDGNVRRILCRLFAIRKPIDDAKAHKQLQTLAASLVPVKHPGDFNQALMDLGATICKAKNPDCSRCPVADLCQARLRDLQNVLPITRKTPSVPHRQAAAAVIRNAKGMLLVVQRPASGLLASLWKLPGGFVEADQDLKESLKRNVKDELGIYIRPGEHLASVNHIYTHFRLTLHAYECRFLKGTPKPLGCQNWQWASLADLKKLPLSKIDRMIVRQAEDKCNEV